MSGQQVDIVANLLLKVDGAEAGLNKLKNGLSKLEIPKGLENSFKKSFSNLDGILARYKSQIEKGFDTKADVTAFAKTGKALDAELTRISKYFTELTGKEVNFRVNNDEIIQTEKELQRLVEQKEQLGKNSLKFNIEGGANGFRDIEALLNKLKEVGDKTKTGQYASNALEFLKVGNIQGAVSQLDKAAASCKRFGEEKQKAFQETGFDIGTAIQLIIQLLTGAEGKLGEVNGAISSTQDKLNNLHAEQVEKAGNYAEKLSNDFDKSNTAIRQADGAMQDFARSSQSMAEQVKQLQQSTQYFFGLRNMLNLFKRGIREAVDTVKQLDKAMTETAVVTKFSVSDMWAKLPEYTANANALGATVQDMYEATTLYYQQGLNSQQAMEIAAETMKMARIGGLEAAEATDMMTAALRGFNMELNETSAQRINDVYSNLAAKTASNTQELGTAMQRTASIAASAGMSFEGTAAFLAQAIETTREPAENLGTAMKTIVARFTELKKNPLEIADVDGEEVSYNKVDAALQSIGVSLKDTNGQFRDLDQVFLDISQRWDSLSQTQQRYIATTAAGSRQQSRFIAMMSNYERTSQLMEYANNASGASNEQFGKTLDSLEAKLNKFQNAWKEFLMGIMNDSWTKGIVDAGTTVLGIINKLIDVLSFGGKAKGIQSFLSLFMAFKGLKFAGRGANALIGGLAGSLDSNSSFGQGFKQGILGGAKTEISQATGRIEKAIYSLVPHIDKEANVAAANQYRFQESGQYNQARKELINNLGGHLGQAKKGQGTYTTGNILDIINTNQLNKQQQKQFFQASPGLKRNLTNSLTKLYKEVGTDKKTTEALISGFKNGDLGLEEALLGNDKLSTSFANAYKELSEQGNQKAATELLMKHTDELLQTGKNQGLQGKELQDFVSKNLANKRVLNQAGLDFLQNPQVLTTSEKFANVAGQIGAGFMSAGSAVSMFGAQVSQVNPIIGQAISNFGGLLTTVGSLANIIPNIVAGGPVAWGIAAAVTAIGGLTIGLKVHAENVKKKGQEVVDNYKEITNELQTSIDNIKGYQAELSRLSTGVDENGFNINLDDSDYQRYQELVDDLVHQNPAIVDGWNSEGKAIINVNKALKDTIKLKQKDLATEKENYLLDTSGQQLINARNATKEYKKATSANSGLVFDASSLVGDIKGHGLEDAAKAAGFDLDKIRQGDLQAISFLRDHYALLESIYKEGGVEISDTVSDLIGNLSANLEAYEEAIAPVVDYLSEYATEEKLFADLPVELTTAFNEGIKSIAGKDLEVGDMKKAVNYLGLELRDAFDKAEEPLAKADEALNKFAQDLDDTAYNETATEIAAELRTLKLSAEALGQVEVAQWYENQASRIEKALSNSTESISEYVDTLSDNIANAKTNFDVLGEGIDDYYSLADQARGLVETALEEKNTEGDGSKTFWNTYRGLASEEAYNKHDLDKAIADMKQFQKYFTEGAEGSRAFAQKMIDWQDKEFKFTEKTGEERVAQLSEFFKFAADGTMQVQDAFTDLTDEQYAQLASVFDLSADGFTAVLNKLRQFGDLEFSDSKGIRRALSFDDRTIKTNKRVEVEGEKGRVNRLYYGESMLAAEISDLEPTAQEGIINDLKVQGSIQLPSGAENLIKKGLGDTDDGSLLKQFVKDTKGTSNQVENVMKSLIQSGEYNKEDLEKLHNEIVTNKDLLAGADDSNVEFETLYDGIIKELENPAAAETNDHLSSISSAVDTIAGIVAAGKVGEGFLPEVAKQSNNLFNELTGGKGIDTWQEQFSKGKDKKGNIITDENDYKSLRNDLLNQQKINNNYLEELKQGRQAAEDRGDSAAVAEFDAEIAAAEQNAQLIAQYLSDAAKVWSNYQAAEEQASNISENAINLINALNSFDGQNLNALNGILNTAFGSLQNLNLTSDQQKSEISNVLQSLAGKLQDLNFTPEQIAGIFKDNFGIELELKNGEFATDIGQQIQDQISNLGDAEINAVLNIASIKMPSAAKGKNNTPSAIRRVGTMAHGSKKRGYTINGEPTLTGELGPELVWEPKQNAAYMVGERGPQFANISKNAVVWNAKQTKKIKKNSKGTNALGTGARGIHSFGTMAGGNVGGTKIPGTLEVDANANILEVIPPTPEPKIPVKAELEVENSKGGLLSKLFGNKKEGPSIDVAANVTSINASEQLQNVSVVGDITKLNNKATVDSIDATATVTQVTKASHIIGEPISVQATATTTTVKNENPVPQESTGTQTINVVANTSAAQAKINQLIRLFNKTYTLKYQASGPRSISVPISANFTGSWKKTVEINKAAKGMNNHISYRTAPTFGSAAKGRYGMVGPKGKGGLTLTGEEGFEIAWLPDENRSMVLGTKGPQMLNLPSNAVVYTHEQSKQILKQKSVLAGSHNNTATGKNLFASLGMTSYSGGSGSTSKTITSTAKKITQTATQTAAKVGKVSVWWENIARKTEKTQRKADTAYSQFERYVKNMQATLRTTGTKGKGNAYIANMTKVLGYNQAQYKKATKELKGLDTSKKETTIKYKSGKKEKSKKVKLGNYIKYDSESGTYVIDQKKISKVAKDKKRGKNEAKAIKEAAEKKLNEKISKQNSAEDAVQKAKEALDKFGEELYNTFFAWKNELTNIWDLTQRIAQNESNISRIKSYEELMSKRLSTGQGKADEAYYKDSLQKFEARINQSIKKINRQEALITKQQKAVDNALSLTDEQETLANVQKKLDIRTNVDKKKKKRDDAKSKKEAAEKRKKDAEAEIKKLKEEKQKAKTEKDKKAIQKKIDKAKSKRDKANADIKTYSKTYEDAKKDYNDYVKAHPNYLNDTQVAGYEAYAQELQERIDTQAKAQKYLSVKQNADGTLVVDFDSNAFEKDQLNGNITEEAGQAIQDYVKELVDSSEELNQAYIDLTNDIGEMYDTLSDLQQEWVGYANELWDISEAETKKEAENLKKLNDSLNKALKNLLDDIKRKLDERRKQEDNAKTEQDISRKQQRLAALRADTSGGHQVEIAQLEKEIADAQKDYQRSLEDQLLEKLQQQGDLAAEQRERQIELQEAIAEGVNNAALVDMWMADPETFRDDIYKAFKTAKDYDNKPTAIQQDLDRQFESMMGGLLTNQEEQEKLTTAIGNLDGTIDKLKTALENMATAVATKSIEQLKDLGLNDDQIRQAGFGIQDFIEAGITKAEDLRNAGFSVEDLVGAGYKDKDIKKAGYSIDEFKAGTGVSGAAGAAKAKEAGYSNQEIVTAYGSEAAMIGADIKGTTVQNVKGTSAKTMQEIINKDESDDAKQSDLAGVKISSVDVNGSAKGGEAKNAHFGTDGKTVGVNKGSTLYTANWDTKTSAIKGKWKAYTIDKLTAALIKKYPIDGKQALEYAIKNSAVGSKINANMGELVKAAGIAGNTYKIKDGHVASINGTGAIHFNGTKDKKDGVYVWNPIKGTKTFRVYNKNKFIDWEKDKQVGREYRAVLKKKGVKGYATGGLADYTGPAWLDGTPSKPELVLNARDTKNFIMLKDILAKTMSGIGNTSNTYGDIMYEININVDKIEKDYDVDKVIDKVKKEITKTSGYRNVTQVRNLR